MTINKIRSVLYMAARILGDVNAVKKGKVLQRLERRALGKITGRIAGRLFR